MGLVDRLKNFDGHSSVSKEFRVYSLQGAILSVVTILGKNYCAVRKRTKAAFSFSGALTIIFHLLPSHFVFGNR